MEVGVEPYQLNYVGMDADKHTMDALYLGQSLQGTARLYNSVVDFHFHGKIRNHTTHHMRIHVGPPKKGSLMYVVYLMMLHGKMPLYPEVFFELAKLVVPAAVKAVIARRSGQKKLLDKTVNELHRAYARHDEFVRQVHSDHVQDKRRLFDVIDRLVDINGQPLSQMAAPVGRTVRQVEHFQNSSNSIIVDEPTAEALRTANAEVGEMETYTGKILGVDKISATCKLQIDGIEKPVRCKISDPALGSPKNVYTHALDVDSRVSVVAKPVLKLGEISTLYVMDAKPEGKKDKRSTRTPRKKK